MTVSYKAIGRNIRQARNAAQLTQEQTAEKLKMSQLHFGRLERGDRPASLEQLANIAHLFRVSLYSLLNGCVIEDVQMMHAEESAQSFSAAMAHLGAGCSPQTRKLMLSICELIAKEDRQPSAPEDD